VFRVGSDAREAVLTTAQGFDATPRRVDDVSVSITTKTLDEHSAKIIDLVKQAEGIYLQE
jgi:hypothetical protein